jgi:hypothetical protein
MMLRTLPENLLGTRDRALLLVGFGGAFRRSGLVSLDVSDLSFTAEGLSPELSMTDDLTKMLFIEYQAMRPSVRPMGASRQRVTL